MKALGRGLPPLNAMRVFEAAARHGNLTSAAEELCIAASAVSRHVANLERHTELELFARKGNRLEVTAAGRQLADAIAEGFGHVRTTLQGLRQQAGKRTLTLAATYDLAHTWLMPRFHLLTEGVPDHELRVITSDSYAYFDEPDVDISVRYGTGQWPGFAAEFLFGEEAFPVCAPTLLAAHPELREPTAEVLRRFPLLRVTTDDRSGIAWSHWLRSIGVAHPVVNGPVFANYSLLLLQLVAGRGLALGYSNLIDPFLADGRVVRLADRSLRSEYGLYAVYRDTTPSPAVGRIVALLRASAGVGGAPGTDLGVLTPSVPP